MLTYKIKFYWEGVYNCTEILTEGEAKDLWRQDHAEGYSPNFSTWLDHADVEIVSAETWN